MTGEELRMILRFNSIRNSQIQELANISASKLSKIFLRDDGTADVPDAIVNAVCMLLGENYRDDNYVKRKIEGMGKTFRDSIKDDYRRHIDHSYIALHGGLYNDDYY